MESVPAGHYAFEDLELDPERMRLTRDGAVLPLTRKAVEVLAVLLRNARSVVDKEVILREVWPDTFVDENNLSQMISAIRRTLGDKASHPRYVETVARRGYRFLQSVRSTAAAPETSGATILAVLPFRSLFSEQDVEYLGIGLSDSVITRIASAGVVQVRPTSSVLRFAQSDRDPVGAGRQIAATIVLDASLRRMGDRVRVTAQLVDVATGTSVWAATYDEDIHDPLALEDSIAGKVSAALAERIHRHTDTRQRRDTDDVEAHRLYLQARYFADRLTRADFEKGVECFRRAVAIDPNYANAYAALAHLYAQAADLFMPTRDAIRASANAASRAIELDPELSAAHHALACVHLYHDWDWERADQEFRTAIALDRHFASARYYYAFALALVQRPAEAFHQLAEASAMDPYSIEHDMHTIGTLYFSGRIRDALREGERCARESPGWWLGHLLHGRSVELSGGLEEALECYQRGRVAAGEVPEPLGDVGRVLAKLGRRDEAAAILRELDAIDAPPWLHVQVCAGLRDEARLIASLNRAIEQKSWYVTWLATDPMLDEFRHSSQIQDAIRRVGLW